MPGDDRPAAVAAWLVVFVRVALPCLTLVGVIAACVIGPCVTGGGK